jgi:class 3 adenylate cyclase
MAAAGDGEILISDAVREAVSGADFPTVDRGTHLLKGVPGEWELFALQPAPA